MEAEPRTTRRGRARERPSRDDEADRRDSIVIRFPQIDPELLEWAREMLPGRALLRVLRDLPDDVVTHARNARRERLLALRSLIDALIEDAEQPRRGRATRRAREIEIE